jgi:hypothetical protein
MDNSESAGETLPPTVRTMFQGRPGLSSSLASRDSARHHDYFIYMVLGILRELLFFRHHLTALPLRIRLARALFLFHMQRISTPSSHLLLVASSKKNGIMMVDSPWRRAFRRNGYGTVNYRPA